MRKQSGGIIKSVLLKRSVEMRKYKNEEISFMTEEWFVIFRSLNLTSVEIRQWFE